MRISPHVSEKAFDGTKQRTYTFRVLRSATKHTVKREVQQAYEVTVTNVRTAAQPSKKRRRAQRGGMAIAGTKAGFKKAFVTLKEGDSIKELGK